MGEYMPPPGGKHLTSLGDCLPAPSDYSPKIDLTKPAAPHHSVAGPYKAPKPNYGASPGDNDTSKNMTWRHKNIRLKGKGKMRPYDVRDDAHMNDSVGPAVYNPDNNGVKETGPVYSLRSRHAESIQTGPPNSQVQPVDTKGANTPGPNYRPNSAFWGRGPRKSFGLKRKPSEKEGPGPAEYTIKDPPKGREHSLSKRLPPPIEWQQATSNDNPAPNAYDLGTTVGEAVAKSISGRPDTIQKSEAPAPNLYTLPDEILSGPGKTLKYRMFEPNDKPHPGPTHYTITKVNLKKDPQFSIRKSTKPCFPDILNYPLLGTASKHTTPGPGSYEDKRTMANNDQPKFSMRKQAKPLKNEVPGPNMYHIAVPHRPDGKKAPAYSMRKRLDPKSESVGPGPANYNPQLLKTSGGYSMTKRPKSSKKFTTPAPNNYCLSKGQTSRGTTSGSSATFKSRASPFIYSGFRTTRISDASA